MERFSDKVKNALTKFFMLDAFEFSEVVMQRDVLDNICDFARHTHPKEFVAVIGGVVKEKKLIINELFYQEFISSVNSASFSAFLPAAANGVGTVHSHPSSNTRPSDADLFFFNKKGVVHFIIGFPYTPETIHGYDFHGNEINFTIIE